MPCRGTYTGFLRPEGVKPKYQLALIGAFPTILTGGYARLDRLGYFPTPEPVAHRQMELAEIESAMSVLEPSAGQGAIADQVASVVTVDSVFCVEIQEQSAQVLAGKGYATLVADFLTLTPERLGLFDRVVMNPPFERQADIDHVCHAFQFLNSGGRLVSVMSAGVTFRDNRKTVNFREFVRANSGAIKALPNGAFKVSGTAVNTCMVTLYRYPFIIEVETSYSRERWKARKPIRGRQTEKEVNL